MWVTVAVYPTGADGEDAIASVEGQIDAIGRLGPFLGGPVMDGVRLQLALRDLEARLAPHMEALARELLADPGARRSGQVQAAPPGAAEGAERSVTVVVGGALAGRWADLATGRSGGPLELITWAKPGLTLDGARSLAVDWLEVQEDLKKAPADAPRDADTEQEAAA